MGTTTSKPPRGKSPCNPSEIRSLPQAQEVKVSVCVINLFDIAVDLYWVKNSLEEVKIMTIPTTDYVVFDATDQQGFLLKYTTGDCFAGFRVNKNNPSYFKTAMLNDILYVVAGPMA